MGFYEDVKPGDNFEPSASLSNDVRHFFNRLNGFGGGPITAGNPGIVRIPVYNATSAVLLTGEAVSIDISGIVANGSYPAIAFSDTLPCYGVLVKDLDSAEAGDCILSGLAAVQIASTPATGNYASPGTGGVFVRGDEGVPILNISGTTAVVMLGAVKTSGGGGIIYDAGSGINSDLLSGGTISTNFVEGNNIHIIPVEGSTNGAMEISADGGGSAVLGFPNYSGSKTYISASAGNTYINTFTDNRWIIGTIGFPTSNNMTGTVQIYVGLSNIIPATDFGCLEIGQTTLWGFSMPFTIPLPKNTQIQIYATDNAYVNAYAYSCL